MGNPIPPPPFDGERDAGRNVVPNVFGGTGLHEEIEQLRAEGIEVDNDNEPLPEDAEPAPADPDGMRYEYTIPTFCPRRANNSILDSPWRWTNTCWDEVAEKSELDLFSLCLPDEFVVKVILPTTNVFLFPHLTTHEFYKWLGCHFFMACFQGIDNHDEWWLQSGCTLPAQLVHVEKSFHRHNLQDPLHRQTNTDGGIRWIFRPLPRSP